MYKRRGPRMRPPFLSAEDDFVYIIVYMVNVIATDVFVKTKGAPPCILIGGNIPVMLQVTQPFCSKKRERSPDTPSGNSSKTTFKIKLGYHEDVSLV